MGSSPVELLRACWESTCAAPGFLAWITLLPPASASVPGTKTLKKWNNKHTWNALTGSLTATKPQFRPIGRDLPETQQNRPYLFSSPRCQRGPGPCPREAEHSLLEEAQPELLLGGCHKVLRFAKHLTSLLLSSLVILSLLTVISNKMHFQSNSKQKVAKKRFDKSLSPSPYCQSGINNQSRVLYPSPLSDIFSHFLFESIQEKHLGAS